MFNTKISIYSLFIIGVILIIISVIVLFEGDYKIAFKLFIVGLILISVRIIQKIKL